MDTNPLPAGRNSDGGPGARRLAAVLLVSGVAVSFAAGALHPEGANANDHAAAFAEYARSDVWIGVHLGQFAGMAALIAGLLVLGLSVGAEPGRPAWAARFGSWAAVAALALYGALQAVDGVALSIPWTLGLPPRGPRKPSALPPQRMCAGLSGGCAATKASCWVRP